MRRMLIPIVILAVCSVAGASRAGIVESLTRVSDLTSQYDFSNWPGKNGPVRDGFGIVANTVPSGWKVSQTDRPIAVVDPDSGELSVSRRYLIGREVGSARVQAEVTVAGTCSQAQDRLIGMLVHNTTPQPPLFPRGITHGLALGDVCYVIPSGEGGHTAVIWVRNNVLVRLTAVSAEARALLGDLARSLDASVSARPVCKSYAECPSRPVIAEMERVSSPDEVQSLEVAWKAAVREEKVEYVSSSHVFVPGRLTGRGWTAFQVAISDANLIGFPPSGSAQWKASGPSGAEVTADMDAFLDKMNRTASSTAIRAR